MLDKIISKDQTGFLKGRYIGEKTRLVYDILQHTEQNDILGLLLLIDFEKAFDSLSWSFSQKALRFLNFGYSFRRWIKVFYNGMSSEVIQNGNLSSFFSISCGCRQGDPLSPYIFIICAECLLNKVRNNKSIKGIHINQSEHMISQYADDTSVILDGSEKSLNEMLKELKDFANISGLKINFEKTQLAIILLGKRELIALLNLSPWCLVMVERLFLAVPWGCLHLSQCMRFPTIRYVRPAKPQISLPICAV